MQKIVQVQQQICWYLWRLSLYRRLWKLWLERNNSAFKTKYRTYDEIVQSIVWNVSEWAIRKAEFVGISLEALNKSWAAHLQGHSNLWQNIVEAPYNWFSQDELCR